MATEDADGMKAVYLTNIDLEASHDSHLVKFDSHRDVWIEAGTTFSMRMVKILVDHPSAVWFTGILWDIGTHKSL